MSPSLAEVEANSIEEAREKFLAGEFGDVIPDSGEIGEFYITPDTEAS